MRVLCGNLRRRGEHAQDMVLVTLRRPQVRIKQSLACRTFDSTPRKGGDARTWLLCKMSGPRRCQCVQSTTCTSSGGCFSCHAWMVERPSYYRLTISTSQRYVACWQKFATTTSKPHIWLACSRILWAERKASTTSPHRITVAKLVRNRSQECAIGLKPPMSITGVASETGKCCCS